MSVFSCKCDEDIENFLHNRAFDFDDISKTRTYLLLNLDRLQGGVLEIVGYFALALQVLKIPPNISVRQIKALDGFSGKIHGETLSN